MGKALRIISIVFLCVGILFVGVTGILAYTTRQASEGMVDVTGIIVRLRDQRPTVEYTLNDQTCTITPSMRSSGFRVGDVYKLMADPADPWRYSDMTAMPLLMFIFGLLGGVFTVIAVVILIVQRRQAARREELLATGRCVSATVTEVCIQYNVQVNRRHPVYVLADCVHPYTGQSIQVKSPSVFRRDLAVGQTVDVYFDPYDPDKYIVNLTEETK